jgi:hypothetical protein
LDRLLKKGYKIRVICWNFEIAFLTHTRSKKGIWLNLPFCRGGPGVPRSLESVIKRNMSIKLSSMMVAWCQGKSIPEGFQSFHNATLAGYAYEHARTAAHMYFVHAAACQRDVLTNEDVMALVQNDLPRTAGSGIDYPVARNLRKASKLAAQSAKEVGKKPAFAINHLVFPRAINVCMAATTSNTKETKAIYQQLKKILTEDGANYKAINNRWRQFQKFFCPDSALLAAIMKHEPKKRNSGNPNAKALTISEKAIYNAELHELKTKFPPGNKFWMRLVKNSLSHPDESETKGHHVFDVLVYNSVRSNLSRDKKFPYKINQVGEVGMKRTYSKNGGFALCHLQSK